MGRDAAGKAVALDDPLEPLALRDADDVDVLGGVEDVAEDLVARGERVPLLATDLTDGPGRGDAGLLEVAASGLRQAAGRRTGPDEPELDRVVAVVLLGLALDDQARPGLHHRHGHHRAVGGEELGHPDLAPQNPCDHGQKPRCGSGLLPHGADFDFHTGGELELGEGVDGLRRPLEDVEKSLVRPHLELLARLLVDVRRAVDRPPRDGRRQRDRTGDLRARTARGVDDLRRRLVEDAVVVPLEADADLVVAHRLSRRTAPGGGDRPCAGSAFGAPLHGRPLVRQGSP